MGPVQRLWVNAAAQISMQTNRWRQHLPTFLLTAIVFMILTLTVQYKDCDAVCSDWDYVSDLLLSESTNSRIARWDRSPSVMLIDGAPDKVGMVSGAVYELNEILSKSGMIVRFVRQEPADIKVAFVSDEMLNKQKAGSLFDRRIQGFCEWQTSDDGRIVSARILVSRNLNLGDQWGTLQHELGHALGIGGHTDRYLSSLFYSDFKGGALSDGFSSDDRKVMDFLYRHVQPSASETVVRAAFDRHWLIRPQ